MSKHTPEEKWRAMKPTEAIATVEIELEPGHLALAYMGTEENVARSLACLRACAGIPTEQLEGGCVERLFHSASRFLTALQGKNPPAWKHDCEMELRAALLSFQKDPD